MEPLCSDKNRNRIINYRPLFEMAVGLVLGIAVHGAGSARSSMIIGIILLLGIGAACFLLMSRRMALLLAAALIGLALAVIAEPPELAEGEYRLEGKIIEVGEPDVNGRTALTLTDAALNGRSYGKKIRLVVKLDGKKLNIGDAVRSNARFEGWSTSSNASGQGFDYEKYYLSQGVGAKLVADSLVRTARNTLPLRQKLHELRTSFADTALEIFGSDGGTITRMLMGEVEKEENEREELYRVTGIGHILTISGLHMSVIVSFVGAMIPRRHKWVRIALIGVAMLAYCIVAVRTAGILRAAVMTFIVLMASGFEQRGDMLSSVSLAAILILLFNPYQLYSIGFQLSFTACIGIALLSPPISRVLKKLSLPLELGISTTVSASAATIMLQMHYFGTFSTYALLANIAAIPVLSFVLVFALVIMPFGALFPGAASVLAYVPRSLLYVTDEFLRAVSNMPYAVLNVRAPSEAACLLLLMMLFIVSDYFLRPAHRKAEYCAIGALLFTALAIPGVI